jgi:hypothetical protein
MIVKEFYRTREDGVNLYKTYSDEGYLIQKVGTEEIYEEAVDIETALYSYIETEEKIENEEESEEVKYDQLSE